MGEEDVQQKVKEEESMQYSDDKKKKISTEFR